MRSNHQEHPRGLSPSESRYCFIIAVIKLQNNNFPLSLLNIGDVLLHLIMRVLSGVSLSVGKVRRFK